MAKSVAKNALLNGVRTVSNVIFPLITYPYAARVLMAQNLGKVDFATSVVSYFILIAGLGITNYAIREGSGLREDQARIDLFASQIFSINMVSTLLAYVLLAGLVLVWPYLRGYTALIAIQAVGILGRTIAVEWLYSVYEDYEYITIRSIAVQFVSMILMFVLVKNPSDYVVYSAVMVLSNVGANVFNFFRAGRYARIRLVWKLDARRHLAPILVLFGNAVAVTIYLNMDVTLLGAMRGDYEVGVYGVAVKVYTILKQVLSSVTVVSLPRLSLLLATGRTEEHERVLTGVAHALTVVVLPVLAMLFVMARYVVMVVAGEGYCDAVGPMQILSVAGVFALFANFVTTSLLLPQKQEVKVLRASVVGAVANLGLNLFCIPAWGAVGAAATTLLAELCVFLSVGRWVRRKQERAKMLTGAFVTALLCVLAIVGSYAVVQRIVPFSVVGFFASAASIVGAYAVVLLARRDEVVLGLLKELLPARNRA